jgi:hypothetical protein
MRRHLVGTAAVATVLCVAGLAAAGEGARRPRLDLRATPRVAFSPIEILVVGQLKGGEDVEDFYCPGLEWDWGDGTHSAYESDCDPFEAGAAIDRFFSGRHAFRAPGAYNVRLTLRRATRAVAVASVAVTVQGQTAGMTDY